MKLFAKRVGLFVAVLLAMLVMSVDNAEAAGYADTDGYSGSRWRTPSLCVQNQIKNPTIRQASYDAIVDARTKTGIRIVNMGSSSCSGYENVIYFRDGNYATGWTGMFVANGFDWGQTSSGTWTYFNRSGAEIKFNTRYSNSAFNWRHIASHELGHALGLAHRPNYCASVVSQGCSWRDRLQAIDVSTLKTIYGW